MKTLTRLLSAFVIGMAGLTTSCSFAESKAAGEAAAARFHTQFNAAQYRDIYDQAAEEFRKAAKEQDVIDLLEGVHRKLGSVKQSNPTGWRVNTTTGGTTVILEYNTEFTEGNAVEQLVFLVTGNQALLYNYNINSPLLITR